DGAAKAAGIKEGDVILMVDGREVNKQNELQSYIATRHPGDEVTLKIFRDGKTFEKKVTLRPRKQNVEIARNEEDKPSESETASNSPQSVKFENLGFGVRVATAAEAKALNIDKGVIVSDVKPYSEAANRAIRKDDVILEADRKPVTAPGDLKRIVESRKSGESILLRLKRENTTAFVALQIP
ncbi:MAG: PDZ domain-containing protein, partial [Bacteroidetes bacterium]|nr:PDZ domain-containing protein [Bacteroidota bacterium]